MGGCLVTQYLLWLVYFAVAAWLVVWLGFVTTAFIRQGSLAWRYALRSPLFWLVVIGRYFAAPIAIWRYSTPDRLCLTRWRWLETIDNTLAGDFGHQTEHMIGTDPLAWYNRVLWLWRNGGNRFNYWKIGVADDAAPQWAFWDKLTIPLAGGVFADIRLGWSPEGPKDGRRKYVMTIRFKTKP